MPFIAVVAEPDLVGKNEHLAAVFAALGFATTNSFLVFLGIVALAALLLTNLLVGLSAWLTFRVCHLGEYDLARRLMHKYLALPYAQLKQRNSADLLKMVVTEIDRVVIGTLMAGIGIFADAATTVFIVALLLIVHPWVTIATLAVLAVAYLLIYVLVTPRVKRLGSEFGPLSTSIYRGASEALGAVKEIKVHGCEEHFVDRFSRSLLRSSRNAISYSTLEIVPAQALELIAFGGLVFVTIGMIGRSRDAGDILPMIAMFGFAAYRLIPALKSLFDGVEVVRHNMAAIDPLWRDFSASDVAPHPASGERLRPGQSVSLEGVRFRYPGDAQDTLAGVDLRIPAGSRICLMGTTGAGKSTVVDVLLGLLQPSEGRLVVDGTAIGAHNAGEWQRCIGYVPQVVYLTDDTIASNIAFGLPTGEIEQARLERAARLAELHEFVSGELPDGYRTVVGERGARLSGGQRQRIGIARALYRDPAVLVLDEATNELDLATESRILESLRALRDKTIVFVSHKPSVAAACDCIGVVERGRIVACGAYAELTAPASRHRFLLRDA
jgi:ABC-type multidrug transport system fused ATPase/permease subunit